MLEQHRHDLIIVAARALDKAQMIRFSERTGTLSATDLGRTASHYYIKYDTVEVSILKFNYNFLKNFWCFIIASFKHFCDTFCNIGKRLAFFEHLHGEP